jgi:hypothetical protein
MTTPNKARREPQATATDKTTQPVEPDLPRTLAKAYHVLGSLRPRQGALLSEWLAYHQRAAAWYAEVAEIDQGHHHEALAMAEQERQHAHQIKTRMSAQQSAEREE